VHLTEGIESGLLPTPVAMDASAGEIIGMEDTFKITKNGLHAFLHDWIGVDENGELGVFRDKDILEN
jgi:hypothetical protein